MRIFDTRRERSGVSSRTEREDDTEDKSEQENENQPTAHPQSESLPELPLSSLESELALSS